MKKDQTFGIYIRPAWRGIFDRNIHNRASLALLSWGTAPHCTGVFWKVHFVKILLNVLSGVLSGVLPGVLKVFCQVFYPASYQAFYRRFYQKRFFWKNFHFREQFRMSSFLFLLTIFDNTQLSCWAVVSFPDQRNKPMHWFKISNVWS